MKYVLAIVGSGLVVAGVLLGIWIVDEMSWVTKQVGDTIIVTKMSGESWTEMYQYDLQRRLLNYTWSDSQFRNHTINYDPETGEEISRE